MTRQLTPEEREKVKREIEHAEMFGWSNEETMLVIEKMIGRPMSRPNYFILKKETLNDNEVTAWITTFGKVGYIHHFQKRIKEEEYTNQILLKMIEEEIHKHPQNKPLISSLIRNQREHALALAQLGLGSPILRTIKELIDKSNVNDNQRYNITTEELRENSTEDRNTSSGQPDENRVL